MSCCNRRRALLATGSPSPAPAGIRAVPSATAPAPAPQAAAGLPVSAEIQLLFTGSRRIRVEGVVSGRIYRASPAAPLITASQQDVRSLLRSGLFTRAHQGTRDPAGREHPVSG
ncbi:MAG: hypothetical protein ABSA02_16620 [Trebonia sp.]|jgi:hypothetical protein